MMMNEEKQEMMIDMVILDRLSSVFTIGVILSMEVESGGCVPWVFRYSEKFVRIRLVASVHAPIFLGHEVFIRTDAVVQVAIGGWYIVSLFAVPLVLEKRSLKNHLLVEVVYKSGPRAFDVGGRDKVGRRIKYGVHLFEPLQVVLVGMRVLMVVGWEYLMFGI